MVVPTMLAKSTFARARAGLARDADGRGRIRYSPDGLRSQGPRGSLHDTKMSDAHKGRRHPVFNYENGLLALLGISFGFAFFDRNAASVLIPYMVQDLR